MQHVVHDMQVIISHKIIISSSPVTRDVLGPSCVTLSPHHPTNSVNFQNGSIVSTVTPQLLYDNDMSHPSIALGASIHQI